MAAKQSAAKPSPRKSLPSRVPPNQKAAAPRTAAVKRTAPKTPVNKDAATNSALTRQAPKNPRKKTAKPAAAKPASERRGSKATSKHQHDAILLELRAFGLSYPGAHLKSPWPEHLDLAVRDKTFAYLSLEGEPLRISCKLPHSCQAALDLEFTTPTEYGLGKSGWVTATFKDDDEPPLEFLKTWLDESYRAQAPKSLSKGLPEMM